MFCSISSYYEKLLATGEVKCIDEEVPFEIPKGWEWCRLASVSFSIADGDHMPPPKSFDGIPFIVISNIAKGVLDLNTTRYVPVEYYEKLSKERVPQKDDILFSVTGSYGIAVRILTANVFCFQRHIALIKPLLASAEYIELLLNSPLIRTQCDKTATGMAQKTVGIDSLRRFLVPIPPFQEQIKIVEKCNLLEPFIRKCSEVQEKLNRINEDINEELKKSILQEAIQGKLVPQIANEGTAQELLEQIKAEKQELVKEGKLKKSALVSSVIFRGDDNKYWEKKGTTCEYIDEDIPFDVPKSWAWVRLETILNTGSARRVHAKDWRQAGIPFYRAREIGKLADDGFVDNELYIDISLYEDFSSSGVPLPNDLMITAVGTLGKVYIVKENDKFYYKDGSVLCLANKYGLCAEYLKMVIESPFFKGQYRHESQGTTVATLTMVRLQKYFIPLPPLQEQYRIVETYRNIASIMSR